MSYTLYCDPSQGTQLHLILKDQSDQVLHEIATDTPRGDQILKTITTFIEEIPSTSAMTIDRIIVVNQAESFTFIRIVATVCNTLAFTTGARLFTVQQLDDQPQLCDFIIPHYNAEPSISSPKPV